MDIEEYLKKVGEKSKVKNILLRELWGEPLDNNFPKAWVKSKHLLDVTGQKYFDRRLRELRDEKGCDLEASMKDGFPVWRLISDIIKEGNVRTYLSEKEKIEVFSKANYECAVCKKYVLPGTRGLQADHKIPLTRGGTNDLGNWQALCHNCNVVKRRQCMSCSVDCVSCYWAFPEKTNNRIIFSLDEDDVSRVENIERETGDKIENILRRYIKNYNGK
ncbi:HNH endonuclease signature motif containing protein [Acetobacter fabarum]|uniref:HNH endonuclease n=1 Tax=Acetobacter TaxID=434 RepID=UPI00312B729F